MARERLYLFDTTPLFSLRPCGGELGRGVNCAFDVSKITPLPTADACASTVDLPRKGGGEEREAPG
jgi:hypothetical protein